MTLSSVWWCLIPCMFALASCSTGRLPAVTPAASSPGTYHTVRPGETLAAIGHLHGIAWQTLARVNQLGDPHHLQVGQSLWIPWSTSTPHGKAEPQTVPARVLPAHPLHWPVEGVLNSGFGKRGRRFHGGIDISAARGTAIAAAASGVVSFSGRGPAGFGNMVMLDHGRGLRTLYAHTERNLVRVGARVRRGQPLALVGDSGRASGTHVHFEVHQDGRLVDPLRWLR